MVFPNDVATKINKYKYRYTFVDKSPKLSDQTQSDSFGRSVFIYLSIFAHTHVNPFVANILRMLLKFIGFLIFLSVFVDSRISFWIRTFRPKIGNKLSATNRWFYESITKSININRRWYITSSTYRIWFGTTTNPIENWHWTTILLRMTFVEQPNSSITFSRFNINRSNRFNIVTEKYQHNSNDAKDWSNWHPNIVINHIADIDIDKKAAEKSTNIVGIGWA